MVKVIDNFWKARGVINRFNESSSKIYYGVVNISDESMSTIRFCTTPKSGLPHYSYIFKNTEPLGEKIKHVYCSRLGSMLHLDIQKGEEAMKESKFQQDVVGTTSCMKRLMMITKWYGQLASNDTYFSDS